MRLEVRDLSFAYHRGKTVLDGISFAYSAPDVLCILGENGMGKSTLLRCIVGELRGSRGEILIDGVPVKNYGARALATKIAYLPQTHVPFFPFSVLDVVVMGRISRMGYLANPDAEEERTAMAKLAFLNVDHLYDKPYTDISGGERQLVLLAAALVQEPEVLVLDEPTAHLDFGNQFRFLRLVRSLRDQGIGIIMTTHFPDHALDVGGTTAVLRKGRLAAWGPSDDVIDGELLSTVYGLDVEVGRLGGRKFCRVRS